MYSTKYNNNRNVTIYNNNLVIFYNKLICFTYHLYIKISKKKICIINKKKKKQKT